MSSCPAPSTIRTLRRHHRATEPRVTIDVYDTDLTFVILGVAPERVHHRPDAASLVPAAAGLPSYLLCPDYETEAQCPRGSQCEHFHVDTTGLVRREIHVNRAYRTLESVKYARVSTARATLSVYAPNHRQPVERVDSATLLLTAGSEAALKGEAVSVVDTAPDAPVDPTAPSHCAHFYFNRMCNRGRTCRYLHAVHLNPSAADGELAPQPQRVGPKPLNVSAAKHSKHMQRNSSLDSNTTADCFGLTPSSDACGWTLEEPEMSSSECRGMNVSLTYRHDPYGLNWSRRNHHIQVIVENMET